MAKVRKKLPAKSDTPPQPKNLPEMTFEELANRTFAELVAQLPLGFKQEDLADLIDSFLDHATQKISVPTRGGGSIQLEALTLLSNLDALGAQSNFQVLDQPDFRQHAMPLIEDSNLLMLKGSMEILWKRAHELNLGFQQRESILRKAADQLRPDTRPLKVQRGEVRARIIDELKNIRALRKEIRSFDDLKKRFPNFEVVKIEDSPKFIDDDRAYLASPAMWETKTASLAHGILQKYWGLGSEETLKSYRKDYNRWLRAKQQIHR